MRLRLLIIALAVVAAGAAGALVFAQLSDTQTASGTINVTTTSPDLYICEPGPLPPACGPDDSGANETVFEALENLGRGQQATYDIRLRNVGSVGLTITAVTLAVTEAADPGADCPDGSPTLVGGLDPLGNPSYSGVFRLVDDNGDDPPAYDLPSIHSWGPGPNPSPRAVFIQPGGYEDIRLAALMASFVGTENCDGNEWNVSWQFDVG